MRNSSQTMNNASILCKNPNFDGGVADANLSYELEQRREMFISADKIIQENKTRFQPMHYLTDVFLLNLLKPEYICILNQAPYDNIVAEQFQQERERIKNYVRASNSEAEILTYEAA